MPHFRFSIKDIIDKKSKRERDIIYHLEMDKGQSEHFNGSRMGEKKKPSLLLWYLPRCLYWTIWAEIDWVVCVTKCNTNDSSDQCPF